MDIKDGFATSSKEHLWSLVRVHELDEITSNGGEDRSATKELLTPKFGKESDLWVRFDKESVWWKEGSFQRYSAKRSAVGYLL
jgi:hypothetical protein